METTAGGPPRDWREGRRLRALALHEEGWLGKEIAEALGVTAGAISQWLARARAGGREALRTHPPPGPTPKLTAEQRAQLPDLLAKGAESYTFVGDVWTTKRVAVVIQRVFGVRYHPAHVSRLLRQESLSVQKPILRATKRNEAQIAAWQAERWPALLAKPRKRTARSSS
jgi:transposase